MTLLPPDLILSIRACYKLALKALSNLFPSSCVSPTCVKRTNRNNHSLCRVSAAVLFPRTNEDLQADADLISPRESALFMLVASLNWAVCSCLFILRSLRAFGFMQSQSPSSPAGWKSISSRITSRQPPSRPFISPLAALHSLTKTSSAAVNESLAPTVKVFQHVVVLYYCWSDWYVY